MCEVIDIVENNDPCNPNAGGNEDELYYALLSDFVSVPEAPVSETALRDKFLIDTVPVFKAGKCWKKIQAKANTVKSNYEPAGNSGAKMARLEFAVPGNNLQSISLFNISDGNTPYVFLSKPNSTPAGEYEIIGGFKHKATMTATKAGGEVTGEGAMYNFTVSAAQKFEVHYTGTVQLTPQA